MKTETYKRSEPSCPTATCRESEPKATTEPYYKSEPKEMTASLMTSVLLLTEGTNTYDQA